MDFATFLKTISYDLEYDLHYFVKEEETQWAEFLWSNNREIDILCLVHQKIKKLQKSYKK